MTRHIDFDAISRAALDHARSLLPQIISGGKYRSLEYVVKNPRRNDQREGSFKINYKTGQWADFATGDKGGDLVSLVAYVRNVSQSDAARELAKHLGMACDHPKSNGAQLSGSHPNVLRRSLLESGDGAIGVKDFSVPARTSPDKNGKPKFIPTDPPRYTYETRRHVYRLGSVPIRIKIKYTDGSYVNWYRVQDGSSTGWQAAKPDDCRAVPYIGELNPLDRELVADQIFWPEGEKDCDTLGKMNLPAFTFGGVGDGLPDGIAPYLSGRHLVILADNDDVGREHAEKKAARAHAAGAASIRIVHFPELPPKGDVSDFVESGGSADDLDLRTDSAPPWTPSLSTYSDDRSPNDWRVKVITASDLQTKTFPPVRYVLPGYVSEGVTILAGKPKIGKSWLTLDLCIAAAAGRFTLGTLKPLQGDVLYLALEDNNRRLKRRMVKLLQSSGRWPERLALVTEWRRADEGGLENIKEWCASKPFPVLVVIDTLERFRPIPNGRTQAYSSDYSAITGLQKIAGDLGIAIVINHHVRKMDADDPFDTVSGTLGLTGAADTILVLKRQSGGVTLHARGRDIEESETALQFDRGACRWTILGAAAEVHVSNERAAVIKALSGAGKGGLAVPEIMAATGSKSRGAMDTLLFKMKETGDVARVKRGVYALAQEAGKIGQKERNWQETPGKIDQNDNLSDLTNLTGGY